MRAHVPLVHDRHEWVPVSLPCPTEDRQIHRTPRQDSQSSSARLPLGMLCQKILQHLLFPLGE